MKQLNIQVKLKTFSLNLSLSVLRRKLLNKNATMKKFKRQTALNIPVFLSQINRDAL